MHLTRPKSSKRRSRPAVNSFLFTSNSDSIPESPGNRRPDSRLLFPPEPDMLQAGMEVLPAAAPPQSINKYNVLPPIERRQSTYKIMPTLDPPDDALIQPPHAAGGRLRLPPEPAEEAKKRAAEAGSSRGLLLAIRAPCGRRFEQHFAPSDTLQAVRASAEARYGVRYEDAFIQTAAVPHRTLRDLDMTLAQCGILNRSVLCISLRHTSVLEQDGA